MTENGKMDLLTDTRGGYLTIKNGKSHRWGLAWNLLTLALAIHVVDEALHDFLSFYNPTAENIRQQLPWLPLPTFTLSAWIIVLTIAIVILFALSILVYKNVRAMRLLSYIYAVIMIANGLAHIIISFYKSNLIPGVLSSPLLLAAGVYLIYSIPRLAEE